MEKKEVAQQSGSNGDAKLTSARQPATALPLVFCTVLAILLVGATVLLSYRLTRVSKALDGIKETFNHNVTDIRDSMKKVEADVEGYKEHLARLDERTKGLGDQVKKIEDQVDKLGKDIQKNFDEVLKRLPPQ